jgi:hypothetical protein
LKIQAFVPIEFVWSASSFSQVESVRSHHASRVAMLPTDWIPTTGFGRAVTIAASETLASAGTSRGLKGNGMMWGNESTSLTLKGHDHGN